MSDIDGGWARSTTAASEGERDSEESVRGTKVREREPVRVNRREREEKIKSEERGERKENKKLLKFIQFLFVSSHI